MELWTLGGSPHGNRCSEHVKGIPRPFLPKPDHRGDVSPVDSLRRRPSTLRSSHTCKSYHGIYGVFSAYRRKGRIGPCVGIYIGVMTMFFATAPFSINRAFARSVVWYMLGFMSSRRLLSGQAGRQAGRQAGKLQGITLAGPLS